MPAAESDALFSPDFPAHLRRFSRHITAVQTRGHQNTATDLLFSTVPPDHPRPPPSYVPAHDSYDLKNHPTISFRPNLFTSNVERLFISVTPLWAAGINELTRLTTWREPNRTAYWAITYCVCWWYGLVLPAAVLMAICLTAWPQSAAGILFPPEQSSSADRNDKNANIQTEPSPWDEEEVAEAAALAAASLIDQPALSSQSPSIVIPPTNVDGHEPDVLPSSSKKPTSSGKPHKKNLAQQYKPVIYKYGGGIQNIAGDLCDGHERLRNLFTRRFIAPPPSLQPHHLTQVPVQESDRFNCDLDANVRIAIPLMPIFFLTVVLSTETIGRCLTFAIGFALFLLNPIQIRCKMVRDALDANQTILRNVPTDRSWVLATLRNMAHRQEDGLDMAMKLLARPEAPKLPARKRNWSATEAEVMSTASVTTNPDQTSCVSSPSSADVASIHSAISGPSSNSFVFGAPRKREKLLKFAKKVTRVAEHGTQIVTGQRPVSLDLSLLMTNRHRKTTNVDETTSVKSFYPGETKRERFLRTISADHPTGLENLGGSFSQETSSSIHADTSPSQESSSRSFSCYYGNMPGHLTIHCCRSLGGRPRLSFYSSLGQSFKARKSVLVLPLSRIIGMRKMSMFNVAGVWGGIDGIEVIEKDPQEKVEVSSELSDQECPFPHKPAFESSSQKTSSKPRHHAFKHVTNRDEAFLRILILKDWDADEEPGWMAV